MKVGCCTVTAAATPSFVMSGKPNMLRKLALLLVLLPAGAPATQAQLPLPIPLPFMDQGTPQERAACQGDVKKYCEAALPDTMRVANCLQTNRNRISPACNQVLVNHGL
jgi:hypothetical protein